MIVIFDLDGVLVDARDVHFHCLNKALEEVVGPQFVISREDHVTKFDGLSTFKKLEKLGLNPDQQTNVWLRKQTKTKESFEQIEPDKELRELILELRNIGMGIYCASNSLTDTVSLALNKLGIHDLFDGIYGNDSVKHNKPAADLYFACMMAAGVSVQETLIIEDSPIGRQAAKNSGAHTLFVESRNDLTSDKLLNAVAKMVEPPKVKYKNNKLNVLIPMAGGGTRFVQAGYTFPKPLIEVNGKPMIQTVVESLNIDANYIYIVQREQYERFSLKYLLNLMTPNAKIIQIDGMTEGATCTALLAQQYINNKDPLLIANSDQIISWNPELFFHATNGAEGSILTFKNTHPKWSYAKIGDDGYVTEVAEKIPISDNATVGVYYYKHGSDFVKYAQQMLDKNIRVNNEFYICPVYNELIKDGGKVKIFPVNEMHGLGTPEDLQRYLNR